MMYSKTKYAVAHIVTLVALAALSACGGSDGGLMNPNDPAAYNEPVNRASESFRPFDKKVLSQVSVSDRLSGLYIAERFTRRERTDVNGFESEVMDKDALVLMSITQADDQLFIQECTASVDSFQLSRRATATLNQDQQTARLPPHNELFKNERPLEFTISNKSLSLPRYRYQTTNGEINMRRLVLNKVRDDEFGPIGTIAENGLSNEIHCLAYRERRYDNVLEGNQWQSKVVEFDVASASSYDGKISFSQSTGDDVTTDFTYRLNNSSLTENVNYNGVSDTFRAEFTALDMLNYDGKFESSENTDSFSVTFDISLLQQ